MKKKFHRTLTCIKEGKIEMIHTAMFSTEDMRGWAEQFDRIKVGGGRREYELSGRKYREPPDPTNEPEDSSF